ncbi:MAG: hypothetical protein JWM11_4668 [Planctomycetaceae bacterium]|nr:hypothetical protein [Planctomycetaceae bacterium]
MVLDEHVVELLPRGHGLRAAELIGNAEIGEVPAAFDQFDVGVGEGVEELGPPEPRRAGGRLFGNDHDRVLAIDLEVEAFERIPGAFLAGERFRIGGGR